MPAARRRGPLDQVLQPQQVFRTVDGRARGDGERHATTATGRCWSPASEQGGAAGFWVRGAAAHRLRCAGAGGARVRAGRRCRSAAAEPGAFPPPGGRSRSAASLQPPEPVADRASAPPAGQIPAADTADLVNRWGGPIYNVLRLRRCRGAPPRPRPPAPAPAPVPAPPPDDGRRARACATRRTPCSGGSSRRSRWCCGGGWCDRSARHAAQTAARSRQEPPHHDRSASTPVTDPPAPPPRPPRSRAAPRCCATRSWRWRRHRHRAGDLTFVGIPLQIGAGNDTAVAIGWTIHGWLYMVYLVVMADLGLRLRWPLGTPGAGGAGRHRAVLLVHR